jgi:hypothetical protein
LPVDGIGPLMRSPMWARYFFADATVGKAKTLTCVTRGAVPVSAVRVGVPLPAGDRSLGATQGAVDAHRLRRVTRAGCRGDLPWGEGGRMHHVPVDRRSGGRSGRVDAGGHRDGERRCEQENAPRRALHGISPCSRSVRRAWQPKGSVARRRSNRDQMNIQSPVLPHDARSMEPSDHGMPCSPGKADKGTGCNGSRGGAPVGMLRVRSRLLA